MADVHRLHGVDLPSEPVEDVVRDIESLLERARSGELRGFAYATVTGNIASPSLATGWTGGAATRNGLGLGISLLQHRYMKAVLASDSD